MSKISNVKYQIYVSRKQNEYGDKFDTGEIAPQFIPYFNNGQRIEVDFGNGEVKRGTVGITTGWRPCFLLMLTRRSIGSMYTLSATDKVTKVVSK